MFAWKDMDFKPDMNINKPGIIVLILVSYFAISEGQQTPLNPVSYWVFTPHIYNTAIAGSKDFLSLGINAAFQGNSNTQILTGHSRISKTRSGYFSSPELTEYSNSGIGGSVFNDYTGSFRNTGVNASYSYHIPLNHKKLSFLSFGASAKGVYNIRDSSSFESGTRPVETFYPNADLGIYFFSPKFYTGLSATDVLGNPGEPDSLGLFEIPLTRQYFFTAGLKIILSRAHNIVLEPSVLINANDSTIGEFTENIDPVLKLYIENFCIGSHFFSDGKTSFFFQYRYPRFFIGAYYELPNKTPYYKSAPLVEFTFGINLHPAKSRYSMHSRW